MTPSAARKKAPAPPPFRRSVAMSAGMHVLFFSALWLLPHLGWQSPPPFEVEITSPFLGDGPAKLGAPKAFVPGLAEKGKACIHAKSRFRHRARVSSNSESVSPGKPAMMSAAMKGSPRAALRAATASGMISAG